eukprot:7379261-Prymnesium_polylepis.1
MEAALTKVLSHAARRPSPHHHSADPGHATPEYHAPSTLARGWPGCVWRSRGVATPWPPLRVS